jgi:peptidoglycan L-alanyl-D-glutamate endopeptidase CwlK
MGFSTKISDLQPDVAAVAQKVLDALDQFKIPYVVTSTIRTIDEQKALYAQGRQPLEVVNELRQIANLPPIGEADNSYTVTNDDGVKYKSNHQSGRALDVTPADAKGDPIWPEPSDPRWNQIAQFFMVQNFKWGGNWTKEHDGIDPDYPHYEML